MTRLSLWLGVGCVLLLAAAGGSAPAAEMESAGTTVEEARLTQADLEIRKAELRVRHAEQNLADVQARVDEGLASERDLRAAKRELEEAQLALMQTQLRAQEWESQRVTVELKEASLEDALRLIFRRAPYSYVLSPEIGRLALDPLTIHLKEVDLQTAVRVICDTYDLVYRKDGNVYYFSPRSDVVRIGGRTVPVVGVATLPGDAELTLSSSPGEVARTMVVRKTGHLLGEGAGPSPSVDLTPRSGEKPIDLHLDNVPIREAMARLAEAAHMEIVVHEAVPDDIRITAKVYRVSGFQLLVEIAGQAGLSVVQEQLIEVTDDEGHVTRVPYRRGDTLRRPGDRRYSIFHVVPPPEVRVSGSGVEWPQEMSGIRLRAGHDVLRWLGQREAKEGENLIAVPFSSCPDCEQLIMMPDWQFCPRCGTKLPCDEEVGAEAK